MRTMGKKILVACEESQAVTIAFREQGFEAYSCDIQPCSGGHPEWHIQGDVTELLKQEWGLIIAHPPCTYLCRQAARWVVSKNKHAEYTEAVDFFNAIKNSKCKHIVIENPIPHRAAKEAVGNYSQIIQPYQFGHDYSKSTCLWVKGLPLLKPTKIVKLSYITTKNGHRYTKGWYETPRNSKARSKTFPGIAKAMAEQWGKFLTLKTANC